MKLWKKLKKTSFFSSKVINSDDLLFLHYAANNKTAYDSVDAETARKENTNCYCTAGSTILLFKFSDDYLPDCMELVTCCSGKHLNFTNYKFATDKANIGKIKVNKDNTKDGTVKKIGRSSVNVNYLLMNIKVRDITNIIKNINLSNVFIKEIINIIYDTIDYSFFRELIDLDLLQLDKFKSFHEDLVIARNIYIDSKSGMYLYYQNIDNILSELPSVFTAADFVDMINILYCGDGKAINKNLLELIQLSTSNYTTEDEKELISIVNSSKIFYDNIIKGVYRLEDMAELAKPYCLRDADFVTGKIEDSDIDGADEDYINDIKGANVYSPLLENQTTLIDIDEVISEDDPEYNDVK